jgi:hypothetical protein
MASSNVSGSQSTKPSSETLTPNEYLQGILTEIYWKAKNAPGTITTEDARRLSEHAQASDMRAARIISAVESYATANETMHDDVDPTLGQEPHTSLLTVVNDLKVAVEANPDDVSTEVLKTAQTIVSSKYFSSPMFIIVPTNVSSMC